MASRNSATSTPFTSSTARASISPGFSAQRPSGHSGAVPRDSLTFGQAPQLQGNAPPLLLEVIGDLASTLDHESRALGPLPEGRRASLVAALKSGIRGIGRRMSEHERLLADAATIQQRYDASTRQLREARAALRAGSGSGRGIDDTLKLYDALLNRSSCMARMAELRLRCTQADMPEDELPILHIDLEHRTDLQSGRMLN